MTEHSFGGRWTADKLDVLRDYLGFYTRALAAKPFKLVYIDAFAGTGRCQINDAGTRRTIDGSAKIALDVAPAFSGYHFIERKRRHTRDLAALIGDHENGPRAHVWRGDAAEAVPAALRLYDWRTTRGVLFLDPYGLQCSWNMLEAIAATKALDVFFLVSLSGLFRNAALRETGVDESKASALTRFLGTSAWRTHLYAPDRQSSLFDDPQSAVRAPGHRDIMDFMTARLRTLLPYVADPVVLGRGNGPALFALYFAVCNPSSVAINLAGRVGRDILSKLR